MPTQEQYEQSDAGKAEQDRIADHFKELFPLPSVHPVYCPSCGWFGMSDDVKHHECPNCGRRVIKEMEQDPLERWDEVGL